MRLGRDTRAATATAAVQPASLRAPVSVLSGWVDRRRNAHRLIQVWTQLLYHLRKRWPVVRINLIDVDSELGKNLDRARRVLRDLPHAHMGIAAFKALRRFLLGEDVLGEFNIVNVTDNARELKPERCVPALGRGEPERICYSEGNELSHPRNSVRTRKEPWHHEVIYQRQDVIVL